MQRSRAGQLALITQVERSRDPSLLGAQWRGLEYIDS
jgi:hypothetical protein